MGKYTIKIAGKDFKFLNTDLNIKGSRKKRLVIDNNGKKAFFKYEREDYDVSEACSEKISYEIAKILNYECARIELAKDEDGKIGVLNYLFINNPDSEHIDIISYLNRQAAERNFFYTVSNIKDTLDALDKSLFPQFIKIMIFDALVGEQDRHEENWGIEKDKNKYKISPLYDNGCCLLREFKNKNFAKRFYNKELDFDNYIKRSKTWIYKEDNKRTYKHFELIEYLNTYFSEYVQKEIINLNKLSDELISIVINQLPDELLTNIHKKYIIEYLIKRRDILLELLNRGD